MLFFARYRGLWVHFLTAGPGNGPCKKHLSDFSLALPCSFLGMAPFAVGRLAVDTDACSSSLLQAHSTIPGFCLKTKQLIFNYLLSVSPSGGRAGHTRRMIFFCALAVCFWVHFLTAGPGNGPSKKYLSDFSLALPCSFLGMAPFAVGRLAVDTDACSSSLLQAHSTIPGFV